MIKDEVLNRIHKIIEWTGLRQGCLNSAHFDRLSAHLNFNFTTHE